MNKDRLRRVADAIEKAELASKGIGFNMFRYISRAGDGLSIDQTGRDCGTVACIAGWAAILNDPTNIRESSILVPGRAQEWLELSDDEAEMLFVRAENVLPLTSVSTAHAVTVLRHAADTGEISIRAWEKFGHLSPRDDHK